MLSLMTWGPEAFSSFILSLSESVRSTPALSTQNNLNIVGEQR